MFTKGFAGLFLRESSQLTGGEKAAYKMGLAHGKARKNKLDNPEKSFGVHAEHYHKGHEDGLRAAEHEDWKDEQRQDRAHGRFRG